jgi:hypothetical protein
MAESSRRFGTEHNLELFHLRPEISGEHPGTFHPRPEIQYPENILELFTRDRKYNIRRTSWNIPPETGNTISGEHPGTFHPRPEISGEHPGTFHPRPETSRGSTKTEELIAILQSMISSQKCSIIF